MDSACLRLGEKVRLKLRVKLTCSPHYTEMVPKWHLAGQLTGTDFFNLRVHAAQRAKMFPFSLGVNLGGVRLLKNGKAVRLKLWASIYPNH